MLELDFVGFINDNCNLTPEKKVAMLADFCEAFGKSKMNQREFANMQITRFITSAVHRTRKRRASRMIEMLELKKNGSGTVVLP